MDISQFPLTGFRREIMIDYPGNLKDVYPFVVSPNKLAGLKVDESGKATIERRDFRPDKGSIFDYDSVVIEIFPLTSSSATETIKGFSCGWNSSSLVKPARSAELAAPNMGDGARACEYTAGFYLGGNVYTLFTGTRSVAFAVHAASAKASAQDALVFVSTIADRQFAVIDRVSPPGPSMAASVGAGPFQFNAPATLPDATAGKPYKFSFCQPEPTTRTSPCGPMPATTSPTGGLPPYHFQYGTMGGFPPFGLTLGKDGHLDGTPVALIGDKTYDFTVCAIDLKADYVCRDVSLNVNGIKVRTVEVTPKWETVQVGAYQSFQATPKDADGKTIGNLAASAFTWTSGDPAIATVDANGTVKGISKGAAFVNVSVAGAQGKATVTVEAPQQPLPTGPAPAPTGGAPAPIDTSSKAGRTYKVTLELTANEDSLTHNRKATADLSGTATWSGATFGYSYEAKPATLTHQSSCTYKSWTSQGQVEKQQAGSTSGSMNISVSFTDMKNGFIKPEFSEGVTVLSGPTSSVCYDTFPRSVVARVLSDINRAPPQVSIDGGTVRLSGQVDQRVGSWAADEHWFTRYSGTLYVVPVR